MKTNAGFSRNSRAGRGWILLFATGVMVAGMSPVQAATITGASLTPMGFLDPAYPTSRAMGVSSDGNWVVGYSLHTNALFHAVKWNSGVFTDLGDLPGGTSGSGDQSWGFGISGDGSYVAGQGTIGYKVTFGSLTFTFDAFRPFKTPPMTDISGAPASSTSGEARAISDAGGVVAGTYATKAFYYDTARHDIGNVGSEGLGVSPNGAYVLGHDGDTSVNPSSPPQRAFRYQVATSTKQFLGALENVSTYESAAYDATQDGSVVVGWSHVSFSSGSTHEAFVWDNVNGMAGLGDLTDPALSSDIKFSEAYAISPDGQVIVGKGTLGGSGSSVNSKAFIYFTDGGGMQLLSAVLEAQGVDLSHWNLDEPEPGVTYRALREATGVTVVGNTVTVVGWGVNTSNQEEGFVATLTLAVPEPGHYAMVAGLGLGVFGLLRRRNRLN